MRDKVAFLLMEKILLMIKESGANQSEALSAIRGAEAMLPELDLQMKPACVIRTDPRQFITVPGRRDPAE